MLSSDFWRNKKVLITGHTGFKGSWILLFLLNLGAEVYGFSLEPNEKPNLFIDLYPDIRTKFTNFYGDICEYKLLENYVTEISPDVVIHLAAQPLVRESYRDPLLTWNTNVIGTLNLLESLKKLKSNCSVVIITTDKVYENREWEYGYRENDQLGGSDPYSASKASTELAVYSWRKSFCGSYSHQTKYIKIASARAGNVIGGGDWAKDRIIPDAIRYLKDSKEILVRNPYSTRPWQHVLEPLCGYLILAEKLSLNDEKYYSAFNFGPHISNNKSVKDLISYIAESWPGSWVKMKNIDDSFKESTLLHLQSEKAYKYLNWESKLNFIKTIDLTLGWYKKYLDGQSAYQCCIEDIRKYMIL